VLLYWSSLGDAIENRKENGRGGGGGGGTVTKTNAAQRRFSVFGVRSRIVCPAEIRPRDVYGYLKGLGYGLSVYTRDLHTHTHTQAGLAAGSGPRNSVSSPKTERKKMTSPPATGAAGATLRGVRRARACL